ncbi:MAG: hypothetical protein JXB47_01125 [Anaerolineae bacterium]|nr:hypothetical protein [Anaerolineae bacterium]
MVATLNNKTIALYVRATMAFERLERGEGASDLAKRILIAVLLLSAVASIIYGAVQSAASQAASAIQSPGW